MFKFPRLFRSCKSRLAAAVIVFGSFAGIANGALVITNGLYTANSVTFTVVGDLSGYAAPAFGEQQLQLVFYGDSYIGNPTSLHTSNSWNMPIFDGNSFIQEGNVGGWGGTPYAWFNFLSPVTNGSVVSMKTVIVSWAIPTLDPAALNPDIRLVWGVSSSGITGGTELGSIVNAPVAVPEPSSTALLGLGGLALMLRRRR